jgi:hypothetical protein
MNQENFKKRKTSFMKWDNVGSRDLESLECEAEFTMKHHVGDRDGGKHYLLPPAAEVFLTRFGIRLSKTASK